jgi:hypothetical protein
VREFERFVSTHNFNPFFQGHGQTLQGRLVDHFVLSFGEFLQNDDFLLSPAGVDSAANPVLVAPARGPQILLAK